MRASNSLQTKDAPDATDSRDSRQEVHRNSRWIRNLRSGTYNLELPTQDLRLFFIGGGNFQNREEGFLRNVHLADALHAALAFFLFFEQLAFARDVAAVALGKNVLANRCHR